jgi:hypothetical protein
MPRTIDEVVEAVSVTLQPGLRFFRIFGSGAVLHGYEFFSDAHAYRLNSVCGDLSR